MIKASKFLKRHWPGIVQTRPHLSPSASTSYAASIIRSASQLSQSKDQRARLSSVFTHTGGRAALKGEDAHAKLIKASILRQAHSGIFHLLPLGLRIQEKIERLIDKHMQKLGASKVALSSISSEALWRKSGRYNPNGELFLFKDRKDASLLLCPTHEEEITNLVASTVTSYRQLPLRLYQISRKYRDELRPRQGLLRGREFVMKDLYTFDYREDIALSTYHEVRQAYVDLFDELKIPYLVADADSGDIGGDLSHEFHFPTPSGEDHIINCDSCGYVANEELAHSSLPDIDNNVEDLKWTFESLSKSSPPMDGSEIRIAVWRGVSRDRSTLINVWYTASHEAVEINTHAVKKIVSDLDSGAGAAEELWAQKNSDVSSSNLQQVKRPRIVNLVDCRVPSSFTTVLHSQDSAFPVQPQTTTPISTGITSTIILKDQSNGQRIDLLRIKDGDKCPSCSTGKLHVQRAIELGHTFHLGTKYSVPLEATVKVPNSQLAQKSTKPEELNSEVTKEESLDSTVVPMQMGCHGIGVTRLLGAVAEILADEKGLNWPRLIAPYEVVIIAPPANTSEAESIYDSLASQNKTGGDLLDVILDDREKSLAWKMSDADLIGYPVIVIAGKGLQAKIQTCEIQCRRLGIKENVEIDQIPGFVSSLLSRL